MRGRLHQLCGASAPGSPPPGVVLDEVDDARCSGEPHRRGHPRRIHPPGRS